MGGFLQKFFPKETSRKLKTLYVFVFLVVFLISATLSFIIFNYKNPLVKETSEEEVEIIIPTAFSLQDETNIVLLGYGGAGHDGGTLTDSIIVFNINPEKRQVVIITVPRDTWVKIPIRSDISKNFKINHAYAIGLSDANYPLKEPQYRGESGAATLTKEAIEDVIGMPVQYYFAVDFEGFKNVIDILGGVDVEVPVTFDDYFYPVKGAENDTCNKSSSEIARLHQQYSDTELHHQFECRYEHIHYDAGANFMDGETALKFVRSRASAQHGGDFARSERQQAVLTGIKDKLLSMNAVNTIDELFDEFTKIVRTDLDLKTAKEIVSFIGNPEDYRISFVGLSEENVFAATKSLDGQSILIPKEGEEIFSRVHTFVREQISNP
jgi:anionic cell wall polymer biosynthesis LytR-Cps2A-Psr (LCP) family protein